MEKQNQFVIYLICGIVALLIGFFVCYSETYGQWYGMLAFGIVLLASLIINSLAFGKALFRSVALILGIVSLLSVALGTYYSFDLMITIFVTVLIACIVAIIGLTAQE